MCQAKNINSVYTWSDNVTAGFYYYYHSRRQCQPVEQKKMEAITGAKGE